MSNSLSRNTAGGVGAGIILWGLIISMLVFTSIRTIHLLQLTFPPDQQYVAYLGLAAFDVGVLGWFFYATQKARGAAQRAVAYGMIFVCAAGVVLATVADFFYQASQNGVTTLPPQLVTVGIWGVIIVVCLNFIGGIVAHLVDPAHLQRMKEEELHDKIMSASHAHMATMTDQIAPQIAEVLALEWRDRITAELVGKLPQASISLPAAPTSARVVESDPIPAPAPKKEPAPATLAQTAPARSEASIISGVVSGIKNTLQGFKTSSIDADRVDTLPAASGLPKKDLPRMQHHIPHHRTRSRGFIASAPASTIGVDDPKKANGVPVVKQAGRTRNSSTPSTGSTGNNQATTQRSRRGKTRQN